MNRLPDDKRLQFVPQEQRAPLTPQLALRVAVLGSLALAMFAIIFFRLWFLQVLSGDQYLAQASSNRARLITVPAPRGQILDRSGSVLVDSTPVPAVLISPPDLPVPITTALLTKPPPADERVYDRLATILAISKRPVRCKVPGHGRPTLTRIACAVAQKWAVLPYANVTIKTDVPNDVQYYLQERQAEFSGVEVQQVWLRRYPMTTLAAQLFGTVGPISCNSKTSCELHDPHFKGISQSSIVGQSGLEYYYDNWLRGVDGADKVQVDALGRFRGDLAQRQPVGGNSLKLSLDVRLQQVGQAALAHSMSLNASPAGSFVAMNPVSGEVYGMGSLPSFDPNVFTHPITIARYNQLFGQAAGFPQLNRAIQSAGPTGSTFKPITSIAALQSGAWSVGQTFDDTGQYCVSGQCRHNAGNAVDGVLDLVSALRVSSDDFFYNLGAVTNVSPTGHPAGGALQHWAKAFGVGTRTGVDLGGEVSGNLPTPLWRERVNQLEAKCDARHHRAPGGCGIADGTNRPWSVGDNESLAVGQGDVQVTPLQLAVAYSAIANGGAVVRPHVGLEVDSADGTLVSKIAPPAARRLPIDPAYLDTVRAGLRAAASQPGGTSAEVFGNFPEAVYGKTGTAQYTGQQDYSWYACFVPPSATRTPIVVVVKVEQGGFGAVAAAPVARQILSQWFFGHPGPYQAGSSKTL
ncbi:MAG: penicillin-binding protein 2 [Solirubrobacteraceae bacterium]|jgi:penicillin-binding protein 2|nr:penicillin-binding protein 2 [Solirubrobacteraceae bacterium]